jgi:excinuclease ABC subunit C
MTTEILTKQVKSLPASPGVYLFKDNKGKIIYVGKAASLRNRVRSYFNSPGKLLPKTLRMTEQACELDFFTTASEQEALILELNLIKRYHPEYNVRLKDDKSFPYLKIETNEEFPRIYTTRRLEKDGGRYFGPFASAWSVRETIKILRGIFPLRYCNKPISGKESRACLEYHIRRCAAPCIGAIKKEEYDQLIKEVILFLEGKQEKIVKQVEARMKKAADALDFETAARLRDQIGAITSVIEAQSIATRVKGEQDAIAFARESDRAYVQVYFIRNDKLTGRESFVLQGTAEEEPAEIMTNFVEQFYSSSPFIPPRLLLQYPVKDLGVIQDWLREKRGGSVSVEVPQRGNKKTLIDTVAENARQGMEQLRLRQSPSSRDLDAALEELQDKLDLPRLPERIEGYDISNVQGHAAVGSLVVFEEGKPKKAHYRRFSIKTVEGSNDYAMLQEVLHRRFKRLEEGTAENSWGVIPDLVLVDGGKGQLNAAVEAMGNLVISIPVIGLAKENEEIFLPDKPHPVVLPPSSPGLQLLQRLRDEAHRFAIGYFQKRHGADAFKSALDSVQGIGPKRKKALLKHFGSVESIRNAQLDEIAAIPGMTLKQAQNLKSSL